MHFALWTLKKVHFLYLWNDPAIEFSYGNATEEKIEKIEAVQSIRSMRYSSHWSHPNSNRMSKSNAKVRFACCKFPIRFIHTWHSLGMNYSVNTQYSTTLINPKCECTLKAVWNKKVVWTVRESGPAGSIVCDVQYQMTPQCQSHCSVSNRYIINTSRRNDLLIHNTMKPSASSIGGTHHFFRNVRHVRFSVNKWKHFSLR